MKINVQTHAIAHLIRDRLLAMGYFVTFTPTSKGYTIEAFDLFGYY